MGKKVINEDFYDALIDYLQYELDNEKLIKLYGTYCQNNKNFLYKLYRMEDFDTVCLMAGVTPSKILEYADTVSLADDYFYIDNTNRPRSIANVEDLPVFSYSDLADWIIRSKYYPEFGWDEEYFKKAFFNTNYPNEDNERIDEAIDRYENEVNLIDWVYDDWDELDEGLKKYFPFDC